MWYSKHILLPSIVVVTHPCIVGSIPAATVKSWLMAKVAAYQCWMLHPIAKCSIPLLDHSKPSETKKPYKQHQIALESE
jgi:hypothetical protein